MHALVIQSQGLPTVWDDTNRSNQKTVTPAHEWNGLISWCGSMEMSVDGETFTTSLQVRYVHPKDLLDETCVNLRCADVAEALTGAPQVALARSAFPNSSGHVACATACAVLFLPDLDTTSRSVGHTGSNSPQAHLTAQSLAQIALA